MLHKAWNSKGEMPYCFPRSSIKFQGHTVQNITDFDPNWAFLDCRPVAAFKSLRFALFHLSMMISLCFFVCFIFHTAISTYLCLCFCTQQFYFIKSYSAHERPPALTNLINTLRPRQNSGRFADDISKCILLNEIVAFWFKVHWVFFLKIILTIHWHCFS